MPFHTTYGLLYSHFFLKFISSLSLLYPPSLDIKYSLHPSPLLKYHFIHPVNLLQSLFDLTSSLQFASQIDPHPFSPMMQSSRRSVVSYTTRTFNTQFPLQLSNISKSHQKQQQQLFLSTFARTFSTSFPMLKPTFPLNTTPQQFTKSQFTPTTYKFQPFTTSRRNFGIGSYISEKFADKKNEMQGHKERESFRHLRDYLISCPRFRFKENLAYVETLQAQVGRTDRLIGGQDVKAQEDQLKKKVQMFKSLTPLELLQDSPGALNMAVKSRVSLATGLERKQIEADLKQFDELKSIHTWLQHRLKNARSLPEDSVELQKMMHEDPPPPSFQQLKSIQKAKQQARRGRM